MPEESKKHQQKGKNEPKDQRRRRQRQPAGTVEKKPEKQPELQIEKKAKEPEKTAYEPPGPEFYKSLKRETDEILKITEEANTKYKKKEIQSNWAKYEMPIESYEEIDEQENIGADYEKLIQAPASVGSHFQFKHEKSWDTDIGPSLYDKYFTINMDHLSLAVSTIPFYERNSIDQSVFNENDIMTMNHRATKFKQKYHKDKKYITPEMEAQEIILKNLTSDSNNENPKITEDEKYNDLRAIESNDSIGRLLDSSENKSVVKENSNTLTDKSLIEKEQKLEMETAVTLNTLVKENVMTETKQSEDIRFKPDVNITKESNEMLKDDNMLFENVEINEIKANTKPDIILTEMEPPKMNKLVNEIKPAVLKEVTAKETTKNPVIESPEDLEKWLDDFLDG